MTKGRDMKKNEKKAPEKSMMEKRAAKKAKRAAVGAIVVPR